MFIQLPLIEPKDEVLVIKQLTNNSMLYAIAIVERVDGFNVIFDTYIEDLGISCHMKHIKQIKKPLGYFIVNNDFEF